MGAMQQLVWLAMVTTSVQGWSFAQLNPFGAYSAPVPS